MLVIVDEHTRECLAIDVARKLTSEDWVCQLFGHATIQTPTTHTSTLSTLTRFVGSRTTICELGYPIEYLAQSVEARWSHAML
jgi:hypothetical protein